ncbi:HEAT repeat domain-containing protein [Micromonospora siamensis]|uniref:HEAT repeat-containing protein n=1 Tax=Micromonospora siamensis TaxID=299152 RepID=A0A1C5J3Q8_9ACTN|nr:hypothetical protein [Micromonospora siamensis]SCG65232.1 hypothetical protein GA0074704_4092 [Micromonospora siamensis]
MSISLDELRRLLSSDEPDYRAIASAAGPEAAEHLRVLARDDNVMLASKAVYAASLLPDGTAHQVVDDAAVSDEPLLRIASASALTNLPEDARNRVAERLIDVGDVAVEKLVIRALGPSLTPGLERSLSRLAESSDSETIRDLSRSRLSDR